MKDIKIESFIYLCFFIATSAFYQSLEVQREFENKMDTTEVAKSQFEDAMSEVKNLEIGAIK